MKIYFVNGPKAGGELDFALPEITVGREDGNVLRLPTEGVSRYHARFRLSDDERWMICDQESTNGVKVNGERIAGEKFLDENDLVEIGEQTLRVSGLSSGAPKVIFNPVVGPDSAELRAAGLSDDTAPHVMPGVAVETTADGRSADKNAVAGDGKSIAEELNRVDKIFSGRPGDALSPGSAGGGTSSGKSGADSRRFGGRFFYLLVGAVALLVICITVFALNRPGAGAGPSGKASSASPGEGEFALQFEKTIFSDDNVFRFAVTIDGDTARFIVDDIKSLRYYEKSISDAAGIRILRTRIAETEVRRMPPLGEQPGADANVMRKVVIADGDGVNELLALGENLPSALVDTESALRSFAELHGLQSLMSTPEELRRQANESFEAAQSAFGNCEADPANLRDAILRYNVVITSLEQFAQPPPMLRTAKAKLREAENLRKRKLDNFRYEETRCLNLKDTASLRRIYMLVMRLADIGSPDYVRARDRLFILDKNADRSAR